MNNILSEKIKSMKAKNYIRRMKNSRTDELFHIHKNEDGNIFTTCASLDTNFGKKDTTAFTIVAAYIDEDCESVVVGKLELCISHPDKNNNNARYGLIRHIVSKPQAEYDIHHMSKSEFEALIRHAEDLAYQSGVTELYISTNNHLNSTTSETINLSRLSGLGYTKNNETNENKEFYSRYGSFLSKCPEPKVFLDSTSEFID